jgi:hypothetical protein
METLVPLLAAGEQRRLTAMRDRPDRNEIGLRAIRRYAAPPLRIPQNGEWTINVVSHPAAGRAAK